MIKMQNQNNNSGYLNRIEEICEKIDFIRKNDLYMNDKEFENELKILKKEIASYEEMDKYFERIREKINNKIELKKKELEEKKNEVKEKRKEVEEYEKEEK